MKTNVLLRRLGVESIIEAQKEGRDWISIIDGKKHIIDTSSGIVRPADMSVKDAYFSVKTYIIARSSLRRLKRLA